MSLDEYTVQSYDAVTDSVTFRRSSDGVLIPVCITGLDYRQPSQWHYFESATGDVVVVPRADEVPPPLFVETELGNLASRCSQAEFDRWNVRQQERGEDGNGGTPPLQGCITVYQAVMGAPGTAV
jgi:hypothetical protein